MGWKKRSRRWRGPSLLSAGCISCGLVFVLGNLYVLHSGFSQAYRDLAVAQTGPQHRAPEVCGDDDEACRGGSEDARMLDGLPLLALESIGYTVGGAPRPGHGHGPGAADGARGGGGGRRDGEVVGGAAGLLVLLPAPPNGRTRGFGDARLRKLMGNRRDWGSDAQQSFQRNLQLQEQQQQLPPPASAARLPAPSAGNTGRKQRNSTNSNSGHDRPGTTPIIAHRDQHHSSSFSNNADGDGDSRASVLLLDPPRKIASTRNTEHHARTASVEAGTPGPGDPDHEEAGRRAVLAAVVDVSAAELRRLLSGGSRCGYVRSLAGREYVGSGWTKAVYRADDPGRGEPVAVKTVDLAGHDMATCGERPGMGPVSCYVKASHKLLKEMLLLQAFNDPHIIKMLGYCVPRKAYNGDVDSLVVMVTELGETIDIIRLLQMSWEDRLRVSYGITRLLRYLADSPYGSVSLNDFRRQQFVLVRGDVTLTDLDDVGFEEPRCDVDDDCIHYFSSTNFTLRTPCVDGRCIGFNERKNVFNAARHFTTFLLPHGAPPALRPAIDAIVHAYSNATMRASWLLTLLEAIVERYRTGDYLQRSAGEQTKNKYTVHTDVDLPGLFDYKCRFSIASGCTLSVLDQREAEQLCDLDLECKAFVISDEHTWTGRMVVHLKNNVTTPTTRHGMSLCVKPSL